MKKYSTQINFFLFAEELEKLAVYLKKKEILIAKIVDSAFVLQENFDFSATQYLFTKKDQNLILSQKISPEFSETHLLPVIQFSENVLDKSAKILRRGRFYYEKTYLENGEWHQKDANFLEMASKLFAWFKKNYKNVKTPPYDLAGFIVSQKVADWVQTEKAELR